MSLSSNGWFSAATSKVAGYAVGVVSLAVANLLSIPAFVGASSLSDWGGLATGQAIGSIGSIVGGWGWGVSGPAIIAAGSLVERAREFRDSLKVRMLLSAIVLVGGALVLRPNGDGSLVLLGFLQAGFLSLSSAWYFVGESKPWLLFSIEIAPRVLCTLLAIAAMDAGLTASGGAIIVLSGVVLGAALSTVVILWRTRRASQNRVVRLSMMELLSARASSFWAGLTSAAYSFLPLIIVSAMVPSIIGYFGLLDKVQKQAATALGPFVNVAQGWVPRSGKQTLHTRIKLALLAAMVGSLVVVGGFAIWGQAVLALLSNGETAFKSVDVLLTGLAVGLAFLEAVLARACMVPLNRVGSMARIEGLGVVVGVAGVIVFSLYLSATGALLGVIGGLALMITFQLYLIFHSGPRR